ncbi:MAG: hypothetical protein IJB88_02070 [Clostridia bacterium]|nr:hypothetical protein [Clostridia bacterium]
MKKNVQRLLFAFLCVSLLVSALTVGALAAFEGDELDPDNDPYRDDSGHVHWYYNSETDTIRGLGKEYVYYEPTQNLLYDAQKRYYFENEVWVPSGGEMPLYGYSDNPEILELGYWDGLYVTEAGRVSLDALCNGNAATYRLRSNSAYYTERTEPIEHDFVQSLTAGTNKKTVEVTALKNALVCYLYGYDGTDAYGCAYGGIYQLDTEYYYIHYLTLGNQYFDADGNFSYRSGTVEAVVLDEAQAERLTTLNAAMDTHVVESVWEDDETRSGMDRTSAAIVFVMSVGFLGFLVPLPLLIVSICMAKSRYRGYPKYWYLLTAVSAAWMVVAVLLLIVVL